MGCRQRGLCLLVLGQRAGGVRTSGDIAGVVAVAKGARWYGTVGIVASFVAAGISLYWDAGLP